VKIPDGFVAVKSRAGRALLHLARPPVGEHTVCGRYRSDRYEPEDATIRTGTRKCQVCSSVAAGMQNQRWQSK
jgi:hypothetical protein